VPPLPLEFVAVSLPQCTAANPRIVRKAGKKRMEVVLMAFLPAEKNGTRRRIRSQSRNPSRRRNREIKV
jgi:hypothetical protein